MSTITFKTFTATANEKAAAAYEAAKTEFEYTAHIKSGIHKVSGVEVVALSSSKAAAMKPEAVAIVKDGAL